MQDALWRAITLAFAKSIEMARALLDLQHGRAHQAQIGARPRRARRANGEYVIRGAAWGAPIATVEVQIDNGPWRTARLDRSDPFAAQERESAATATEDTLESSSRQRRHGRGYSWRFWELGWSWPKPGEHAVRSRSFDIDGNMQPPPDDPFLSSKVTYWESNGQITRRVLIPS